MNNNGYMELRVQLPNIVQRVLHRQAISEIIDSASMDEIIYFVAPYGCGKTLSVVSWLKENNKKAAWLTLCKDDNSAVRFWALLSASILRFAGKSHTVESIFNDAHFVENPRAYLTEVLMRESPSINDRTLVMDNFNFIQNKGILLEVRNLLYHMMNCWRIIIIGRSEVPPIFNHFMLQKHLRLITLNELNFSIDEMRNYFSMNNYKIENKDLVQILNDTDGWPAAINVILTVQHNGTISFNSHAKAYVKGFFEAEVWEELTVEAKDFLLKSSILDKLTNSVCHHVTEAEETDRTLRYLYANGIFISKLEEAGTYCYHLVFRDFLLDKLKHSDIDIKKLYLRAGWWLYEKNDSVSALTCFHKANNMNGINQAFKKIRPADLGVEKYLDAALCLTTLDIKDLKDYPSIAVRIALLNFITDNIYEVRRIYKIVLEWLEPGVLTIPPEDYIDFIWEVGWLMYVNPDENILFNRRFDEWINVEEYAPHLLENHKSRAAALRLPSALRGIRDYSVVMDQAERYYAKNEETGRNIVRDTSTLFILDLVMAHVAYEREDFVKAEKIIKDIMPKSELANLSELCLTCTVLLVKIARAVHKTEEIDALTAHLKVLIEKNGHLFLMPNFHAFELRNRLCKGLPGLTEQFKAENEAHINRPYYYLIYRLITYVRALLSEKKYREANLILGRLELLCSQYKRNMDLIEIDILFSIAEYGLEHMDSAAHHIKRALDNGREPGFIRIFSDDAENLWPVLCLMRKSETDAYIKKVIISCKKMLAYSQNFSSSSDEYEALTKAEIGILNLLQIGMSNEEIVINNNVKISTVRSQLHSIYSKLNVDSKAAAIIKAQKMGIIDIAAAPNKN